MNKKKQSEYEKYLKWIHKEVNPKRQEKGFKAISDSEAKKCYNPINNFIEKL